MRMNYDIALKEVDTILKEFGQSIVSDDPYMKEYVLPKYRKEIGSIVKSIFSTEDDRNWYNRWNDQYGETLNTYLYHSTDMQIFQWSEYLKALKRDIERRKRLNAEEQQQKINPTPKTPSYKLPFFLTLLSLLSVLIWMVPLLLKISNWYWQMVAQVLVAMVIMALYSNFNRKKWYITSGIALVLVLLVILFRQEGAKQQLITAGWAVVAMIVGTGLWELLKVANPKSKNL